jgi:amino acid transporter
MAPRLEAVGPRSSATAPRHAERSVGELLGELATETSMLVRQEVKLVTTELGEKATYAAKQGMVIAVGALLGVVSMMSLAAAIVLALGTVIPMWVAALLVGMAIGLGAYVVGVKGVSALKRLEVAPTETIRSLKENRSWARRMIR